MHIPQGVLHLPLPWLHDNNYSKAIQLFQNILSSTYTWLLFSYTLSISFMLAYFKEAEGPYLEGSKRMVRNTSPIMASLLHVRLAN